MKKTEKDDDVGEKKTGLVIFYLQCSIFFLSCPHYWSFSYFGYGLALRGLENTMARNLGPYSDDVPTFKPTNSDWRVMPHQNIIAGAGGRSSVEASATNP